MSDKLFHKNKKDSADLQRQQAKQAVEILVVCEGQTEGDYIRLLRKHWAIEDKIHIIDASQYVCIDKFEEIKKKPPKIGNIKYGSSPNNIVNYAIAVAQKRKTPFKPYAYIFCLFDNDDPIKFAEASQKSKPVRGGKVIKITSIPCFEYWLLLHFEKSDAPQGTVKNSIIKLKKYITDYSEDNKRLDDARFQQLCANDGLLKAEKWAYDLLTKSKQLNTNDPSTLMFELMNIFRALKKVQNKKNKMSNASASNTL
ncbi:MAG: hypothetical protein GQ569_06155 [Methylococcaceae bacterium]|nr:hypothetical protein [Methylococcaceae bacterium]